MIKRLIISETELAMRCACDFCAHLDLSRIVNGKYCADIAEVTFDGQEAEIHYEIRFEKLKAATLRYDIFFEELVETTGNRQTAQELALEWINRFIGLSDYEIGRLEQTPYEKPYFYLTE